jgi:hypothetical protein
VNIGPLFVALLLNQNLGQHNQFEAVALSEHSIYQSCSKNKMDNDDSSKTAT